MVEWPRMGFERCIETRADFTLIFYLYNLRRVRTYFLKEALEMLRQRIRMFIEEKTDSDLPSPLKDTSSLVRFIVIETICMILAVFR